MTECLIAYDITCPRRLQKLHRYLQKKAIAIQYSIFYLDMDERQLPQILTEANRLIDPREDDLRCYPLPRRGLKTRLGKATLPAGIQYTGLPAQWQDNSPPPDTTPSGAVQSPDPVDNPLIDNKNTDGGV